MASANERKCQFSGKAFVKVNVKWSCVLGVKVKPVADLCQILEANLLFRLKALFISVVFKQKIIVLANISRAVAPPRPPPKCLPLCQTLGSQKQRRANRVNDPLSWSRSGRTRTGIEHCLPDYSCCKVSGLHHCTNKYSRVHCTNKCLTEQTMGISNKFTS